MSENVDNVPEPDDDVEDVIANETSDEEVERSFPQEGSDDSPGSMLNF